MNLRNLFRKNKLFTIINISGLSVGIASLLLVSLFIYDEYSFDQYHKFSNRIYRIVLDFSSDGVVTKWAKTSAPIGHYLNGAYPEVEQIVRIRKNPGTDLLSNGEAHFYEDQLYFADSSLLNVFDFKLKSGNPAEVLREKNSIIISEQLARKYFKNEDVIGKTLRYNNQLDLKITGILEEIRANSHFVSDAFITFSSLEDLLGEKRLSHWGQFDHYTYVLLNSDTKPEHLELKFPDLLKKNAPEWVAEKETLFLQPLTSIHLHSNRKDEINPNSKETYSFILGTIAFFILIMASVNFINLSTAMQASRTKIIAIQKILGANKNHLTIYFWIESQIISLLALLLSWIIAYFTLPYFNRISGKTISIFENEWIVIISIILALVIGLLSSLIPTLQASNLNVLQATKLRQSFASRSIIRSILITFQFSISILLITATSIVTSQLSFLKSSRLGFESDDRIVIPVKDRTRNDKHRVVTNEIIQLPGVESASFSSSTPGSNNSLTYTYNFPGTDIKDRSMATFLVDENFFDLYDIKLKEGRFGTFESRDTLNDILLNEAAVRELGLSQPIGQVVTGKVKGRIVGIVENFNHTSLHTKIEPLILYTFSSTFRFVSVRFRENEIQSGIASLERKWPELYEGYPLEYSFLNDQIQELYKGEFQLSRAYSAFSIIAVVIAGIGLIGLTTYLMTRKVKEISIRMIFGCSPLRLIRWLYSDYIKIVLIAILVSWPIGFYLMNNWLDGFAYKEEISPLYFLFPTIAMIFVLLVTTGFQTYRASKTNPVESLREE
ncbi:MAG: ABC transporter permease [Cyclobacteriaceae bacterium]|nr:ABC transporter permease [Cyclobacteriaceae bacterium]